MGVGSAILQDTLGIHKFICSINMCKNTCVMKCLEIWNLGKQTVVCCAEPEWEAPFDNHLLLSFPCSFHTRLTLGVQEQFRITCIHTSLFQDFISHM